jgi:putative DNA primase/helicase
MSFIDAEVADDLCRLATGAGLGKRAHYTNGDEFIMDATRPVLLNGIPSLLARGDLADRALAVTLPAIPDASRRPEAEVWRDFDAAAPGILALLLDALALGLRDMETVQLSRLPRMADFARLACAAAPAFGWTAEDMLDAIEGNREDAVGAVIESDPVAVAVRELMEPSDARANPTPEWRGTASELLGEVNHRAPLAAQRERGWPKDAARLSTRLRRLAPALRRAAIEIALPTTGGRAGRTVTIRRRDDAEQRSERSQRSGPSGSGTCGNAAATGERSGNAASVPPGTGSVPERSAGCEQDQDVSWTGNARNAGNAPAPEHGGGGYV